MKNDLSKYIIDDDPRTLYQLEDKFEYTWHNADYKNNETKREWTIIPGENCEDDGSVIYKYNKDYFRSDEFKRDHSGTHVLFAGDSECEGQGGSMEDAWSYMVYDRLGRFMDIDGFYNLGKASLGWQKVVQNVRTYIRKYGAPDILYILLPNIGRMFHVFDINNPWDYIQKYPKIKSTKFSSNIYQPVGISPEEYKKIFMDFVVSWRLFEDFCESLGIKLIWSTWQDIDNDNFSRLDVFKNFVSIDGEAILKKILSDNPNGKIVTALLSKRDGHHGKIVHEYWAKSFIDESVARGYIND